MIEIIEKYLETFKEETFKDNNFEKIVNKMSDKEINLLINIK